MPMDADAKERVDILLVKPEDIIIIPGEEYPAGTIAHTQDFKACYVWTGTEWEKC